MLSWPHIIVMMTVLPAIARVGEVFLISLNQPLYDRLLAAWLRVTDYDALDWTLRPWLTIDSLFDWTASSRVMRGRKRTIVLLGSYAVALPFCVVEYLNNFGRPPSNSVYAYLLLVPIPVAVYLAGSVVLARKVVSGVARLARWRTTAFAALGLVSAIIAYPAVFFWLYIQMWIVGSGHTSAGPLLTAIIIGMLFLYLSLMTGWVVVLPAGLLILFSFISVLLFVVASASRWIVERVLHYIVQDPSKMVFTSAASVLSGMLGLVKSLEEVVKIFVDA
jgi:hypothetical protein